MAADSLGSLVVSLIAETATFRSELERSATAMSAAAGQMVGHADSITRAFNSLDERVASFGVSFRSMLGFAAGAGFGEIVKSSLEATEQIGHLAEKTGMSVEQFSSLTTAARLSKTSLDELANLSDKFSKGLSQSADGTGRTADALAKLGFSAQDAGRFLQLPAQGLFEVAQRFNTFAESGQKAALAQELFGKAGANALPFLRELGDQSGLTATVFESQVAQAKAATDALTKIAIASQVAGRNMALELAPSITAIANGFLTLKSGADGSVGIFSVLGDVARIAALGLMTIDVAVRNIIASVGSLAVALWDFAHGKSADAWAAMDSAAAGNTARVRSLADAYGELQKTSPILSFLAGRQVEAAAAAKAHGDATIPVVTATKSLADEQAKLYLSLMQEVSSLGLTKDELSRNKAVALDYELQTRELRNAIVEINNELALQVKAVKDAADEDKVRIEQGKQYQDTMRQLIESADTYVQSLNDETDGLYKTSTARKQDIELRKIDIALKKAESDGDVILIGNLNAERAALVAAFDRNTLAKGAKDAADAANQAWLDTAKTIETALTNALFNGFKKGYSFAQDLKDALEQMFKKLVLQPLLQPIAGSLAGLVTGTAGASTGSGGGGLSSLLSGVSSASSLFSGLGSFAGGAGSGILGTIGTSFTNVGLAATAGVDAIGGLGAAALAALPVVGLAVAAGVIAYSIFGSKGGGPKGGGFGQSGAGISRFYTPNDQDSTLAQLAGNTGTAYNSTLSALGGKGSANFAFGFDQDPKGTAQDRLSVGATVNGQSIYGFQNRNEGRGSSSNLQADLTLESQRALLAALQASDLPKGIAAILNSVMAATASADQITRAIAFATAYKQVGDVLAANPMADALKSIATQSQTAYGALSQMGTGLQSLLGTFKGTTDQVSALSAASVQYYNAEVQLLAQVKQVSTGLSTMFGDASKSMTLSTLSASGKNAYYAADAQKLQGQLASATDPAAIQSISQSILADFQNAWGLLSPEQQQSQLDDYTKAIDAINLAAQKRLTDIGAKVQNDSTTLLTQIQQAIADQAGAVTEFGTAVGDFVDAANTPVTVDVNFTADIPGSAQVNG